MTSSGCDRKQLAVGQLVVHGAEDGVVLADVGVVKIACRDLLFCRLKVGDAVEAGLLGAREQRDIAVFLGLFVCLVGEVAGHDVACASAAHEVHGDAGELQCRAALQEQYAVVVGNLEQATQRRLGVVDDLLIHGGAMAHLEDRHPASAVVEHLICDFGEDAFG